MIIIKSIILSFVIYLALLNQVKGIESNALLNTTENDIQEIGDSPIQFNDLPVKGIPCRTPVNLQIGTLSEAKRISHYAGAAYCSDLTLNLWTCGHCKKLDTSIKMQRVYMDLFTLGKCFIAIDSKRKQIILSFRGSLNIRNWISNLNVLLTNFKVENGDNNIKVHLGFKVAMETLYPKFNGLLKMLLNSYPDYKLIITGHSLGGAIATLATIKIKYEMNLPWERIQLYTYGEPRIGNIAFAEWLNSQSLMLTRVVNNRDIVPHLLTRKSGYSQHQREMFIKDGKARICDTNVLEDPKCALSTEPFLSILDHLIYFDGFMGGIC